MLADPYKESSLHLFTDFNLFFYLFQPPPHLLFNQPRPKRCATHCYIARNIQSHQQFTKMNPFWPAAAGSAPLYGTQACNLCLMPPTELQGTVLGRSSNPVPDQNSQSTSKSSDTAQRNQILLQQALPQGATNNIMVSFFLFVHLSMLLISKFLSSFSADCFYLFFIVAGSDIHFPRGPTASHSCYIC